MRTPGVDPITIIRERGLCFSAVVGDPGQFRLVFADQRPLEEAGGPPGSALATRPVRRSFYSRSKVGIGVRRAGSAAENGPPARASPRARVFFLCPEALFLEVGKVHAPMQAGWPKMTLPDGIVGFP